MSFEVLAAIVVINALVTLSLWRKLACKPNRPGLNKKAANALWRTDPIVPKHDPPKTAGGEFSSLAHDVDQLFFVDFKDFADVVNWWLADEFTASRFRLQDLPAGDLRLNVDFSSGPSLGRCFALYYNQTRLGRLEIHPSTEYTPEAPEVYTSVEIDWARFHGFTELVEFLDAIAVHVTSDQAAARQSIVYALTRTLWDNYRVSQYDKPHDEDWGEVNVSFGGMAKFYISRKDAPARKGAGRG